MQLSRQNHLPMQGNVESLVQKDLTETLRLLSSEALKELIQSVLIEIKKHLKVKTADILLQNGEGVLTSLGQTVHTEQVLAAAKYSIKKRKSFYIDPDKRKPTTWQANFSALREAAIFVPIYLPQGNIGILYVGGPLHLKPLGSIHLRFVQSFVLQLKEVFQDAWLDKSSQTVFSPLQPLLSVMQNNFRYSSRINRLQERIASVMKVSNLIHSSNETNELTQAVLDSAREVLRTESASLFMLDKDTGEFYFEVIAGASQEQGKLVGKRIPLGEGIVSLCAENKKAIIVNNAKKDKRVYHKISESEKGQTQNLMAAPLLIDEESIGVIEVINTLDHSHFTHEDLRLFTSFAESVAIAIQRHRLLDTLEKELRESIVLHSVAEILVEAADPQELFDRVLSVVEKFIGVRCQSVLLYDEEKKALKAKAVKGRGQCPDWENISSGLAMYIYEKRRSVMIADLNKELEYQEFIGKESHYETHSCILLVLKEPKEDVYYGVFCLSDPKSGKFTKDNFHLLSTIASELSRGYYSFLMEKKISEQRSIQKEIEIASQIQKDILPRHFLQHDHVEIEARAAMLSSVGGDLYYYHSEGPQSPVHLLIGDVAGKSLSAALFMAVSSSMLKTMVHSESIPAKILSKANTLLFEESKRGMFVTLFLAHYDPESGILQYASAGHNQMLLLRKDGSHEILNAKGLPLGVSISGAEYLNKQTMVQAGDMLVLYTDGITEAVNSEKKEFGLDRLLDLLKRHENFSPKELINRVFQDIASFCDGGSANSSDDLALLVCRFKMPLKETKKYSWRLPATKETAQELLQRTEKIMLENNLRQDIKSDLLLIVEEAVVNIINYAYQDLEQLEQKEPQLEYSLKIVPEDKVSIEFQDEGKYYDFYNIQSSDVKTILETNTVGGFGIHLIRSLADHVSYNYKEGKNILRMDKKIS